MGALGCIGRAPTDSTEVFSSNVSNMSSTDSINETRRDLESQKTKDDGKDNRLWWRLGVDVPIFLIAATLLTMFELGVLLQHKSGFFCNDPALSYKFTGDTVSTEVIVSTIILLPFIVMFLTEYILFDSVYTTQTRLQYVSRRTGRLYGSYVYALFFNLIVVEVMKGITGNPRPTFFDLCEPDTGKTCNGSEYVATFECTSSRSTSWLQRDSYHSFPSGHTSLSVLCGFFMAWYLQRRAFSWRRRSVLVVPLLQVACVSYSALCSLSRITDHRHHWWDVLVGAVVGVLTFLYAVYALCNNFTTPQKSQGDMTASQHTVRSLVFREERSAAP
ncbi:phospholipid phosphatase 2-like isoform X1 [Danaus plexippus]|uniref:phospholipid phosphatase 2-like isoform X1 n=1 Tax=Danaus plexippus TaxID=13037 RepID=UPI002AAFF6E8|nr:phospholipid phosphatase 2-like isoform X1 [Danaus plexippus]